MNHEQTVAAEIRDLRVRVDGRSIVDGVSLRVLPGRITALIGASGSGKTTTGLALLGEYPAGAEVTGEVRVKGAGRVGYVPQHPAAALNPARRVSTLLMDIARARVRHLPLRQRRLAARERVLEAMSEAQLPPQRSFCDAIRTSSPAASSNASFSHRRCCSARGSSSRTNRPRARTR
ncbi:hypothetical protein SHKM778_25310 [Streptomyces sp. KM77-8]|uniref:ABC transporter domain-containing protein n=1 Tax=Streptomyces haneummycinicus TaxID=3074435 RepID=A0AAT9HF85_9ACTN